MRWNLPLHWNLLFQVSNGQKVFSTIEDELLHCDRFAISVAFITRGGVTPLLQTLQELERRGVPGRILTTDYLCFSDPVALTTLAGLTNIELRMYQTEKAGNGFHTKGYIFQEQEEYRFIIGSSNLTQDALTRNMEWNTKLISTDQGEMIKSVMGEFDKLWNAKEYAKSYEDFIDEYQRQYEEKQLFQKMVAEQKRIAKNEVIPSIQSYSMQPNTMQKSFVYNLRNLRKQGIDKALLISATGTGKTYASAFAMRELGFKRVLFLVHRNQIAKQAKKSFENVFGSRIKTGLVSGAYHDYDAEFVFATVQTLSKDEHLQHFSKDYFDACIYDEAHHTSANSYKKVMDYFTPQFTLGMTATPDKRDDNMEGRNIYEIFHHNIAYEIRLQQAMEEDLLCPFHYFGITDLQTVSDAGKSHEEQLEHFRYLTCDDRVNYVMKQANYFGYSGDRVKGLIFCSRIDEARELSRKFNERGWRTLVLSGADSEEARAEAIERLVMDVTSEEDDYLDYLITVDIFSEGTDIVEVNQVIMLRPTQSPIVFVQQLGRGLRKHSEKEYVVILDFIGNYKNNFMIPIALSGDRTYNKDTIRRYVMEGARVIPGSSSIHFDEISKKRIYEAIDKLSTPKKMLIEKYIKTVNLYKEHYQGKALNQKVKQVINQKTKVKLHTSLDSSKLNQVNVYFNFLNYALLAGGVYCMTMILASLNQEGVRKRTIMSSFSYRKYNWIVFASLGLASFIVWLAYMIISFILFKEIMLSGNGIAYILNSFVFSICSLAVGFLIGTITHNKQAIGGIVNVVALGTSFLCGCFVPMSFMPSYVLKIAHILPTYYFVQNNELIKTLEYFKLETLQPIIINGIIVLGFTLSFVLITLMISKRKQKIG